MQEQQQVSQLRHSMASEGGLRKRSTEQPVPARAVNQCRDKQV
jgi:hypothetical protein